MKKLLLVTSAIVAAAGFTSEAFAQAKPVTLSIGGFYGEYFVYNFNQRDGAGNGVTTPVDGGNNRRGRTVASDGEIHFKGSTTLDNGLQVGAQIELEADVDADQIDEAWIDFRGSFGRVILGKFDPVVRELTRSAPNAIRGGNTEVVSINEQGFITHPQTAVGAAAGLPAASLGANAGASFSTLAGFTTSDGDKIYWQSPSFSGFQVSVSYMPKTIEYQTTGGAPTVFAQAQQGGTGLGDYIDAGLEYNGKLGDVGISAAVAVETASPEGTIAFGPGGAANTVGLDGRQYAGTASGVLTFGDFKFGGAVRYAPYDVSKLSTGAALPAGSRDSIDILNYEVGASYSMGPWLFALTHMGGKDETLSNNPLVGGDVTKRAYMASTSYLLGPGVAAIGGLIYEKIDYNSGTAAPSIDNRGTTFITGIGIGF